MSHSTDELMEMEHDQGAPGATAGAADPLTVADPWRGASAATRALPEVPPFPQAAGGPTTSCTPPRIAGPPGGAGSGPAAAAACSKRPPASPCTGSSAVAPLQLLGDAVRASLATWLSPASKESPEKKSRGDKDGTAQSSRARSGSTPMPFTAPQAAWLQGALVDTLATFGEHVETRVDKACEVAAAAALRAQAAEDAAAAALRVAQESKDAAELTRCCGESLGEQLSTLQKEVEQLRVDALRPSSASPSVPPPADAATALQRRTTRMGNLGWDTPARELEERAKQCLAAAGVPPEAIVALAAVAGRSGSGSAAQIIFLDDAAAATAIVAVRGLRRQFCDGRFVWLDVQRSPAQQQLVRVFYRGCTLLQQAAEARSIRGAITRQPASRTLLWDNAVLAWVTEGGAWQWASAAAALLPQDVRRDVEAFASAGRGS